MIKDAIFAVLFVYMAFVIVPRFYAAVRHQAVPVRVHVYRRSQQPTKYWTNTLILALVAPLSVFAAVAFGHAVLAEVLI